MWFTPKQIRGAEDPRKLKTTGRPRLSDRAVAWFASRGISTATLTPLCVSRRGRVDASEERAGEHHTVQLLPGGELVNTKFRTGDKCFKKAGIEGGNSCPIISKGLLCIITDNG